MKFYKDSNGNIFYKSRDGSTDALFEWITNEYQCEVESKECDNMEELETLYLARFNETKILVDKYPAEKLKNKYCIHWGQGVTHISEQEFEHYCKSTEYMSLNYNKAREGLEKKLNKGIKNRRNWINRVKIAMGKVD